MTSTTTRSTAVRVVSTGARLVGGIVVSAACVVGVIAAVPLGWPGVQTSPAHTEVEPYPGETMLTCSGPFRAVGRDATNATQQSTAGVPAITVGADGTAPEERTLEIASVPDADATPWFLGQPEDRELALIAAAESVSIASEDLAGFAASACGEPAMESWIVGGAAGTGASDVLVVSNPGAVIATVTFTFFGSQGAAQRQVVVPASTQVSLPLAEGAAGEDSPVVRVTSSGAPVRAALQSSLIRVLDPAGIDIQEGVGRAETSQTLLSVRAVLPADIDGAGTVLRLLAPDADADVVIRASAEDGAPAGADKRVSIEAGQPSVVDLTDLGPGLFTLEVEASAPVVAAAWQTTGLGKDADFAWMTPAPLLDDETVFAVADGPSPRIQLQNPGGADVEVELAPVDGGDAQTVTVPAGASLVVDATADTVYALRPSGEVRAAVSYVGAAALAGYPVSPMAKASQPVVVTQ